MTKKQKVILVILDGFGVGDNSINTNAIYAAKTPFFDKWWMTKNMALLSASEEPVGLCKNQFGNSELGHMTIGSGQIIHGINEIILNKIKSNEFEKYLFQQDSIKQILQSDRPIHLVGMYSNGKVHSNSEHFDAIINFFQKHNKKIALYLISDGRDTERKVFLNDIRSLSKKINKTTKIIAIGGRYYGMDRDKNFDRTQLFYDAMMQKNNKNIDCFNYIENEYKDNRDDEFIIPISFCDNNYLIQSNDSIIFLNYRADRIRQLIHCFKKTKLFDFETNKDLNLNVIGICDYPKIELDAILVKPQLISQTLSKTLSENSISQLHIAETEKFAHVSFFFNGGNDEIYPLQKNILIPSKKVKTYDLLPEMSANEITQKIVENIEKYDFIVVNYANADMVGHTGNFFATKQAIEILDNQCRILYNLLDRFNGTLLITADHGNADQMVNNNGEIVKTHTIAKVPFIVLSKQYKLNSFLGSLQDIAPSVLFLYGLEPAPMMIGKNLLTKKFNN